MVCSSPRPVGPVAGAAFGAGEMQQQQQQQPLPAAEKLAARVDTQEIRARLFRRVGNRRAELYFRGLKRFLDCELGKEEFDRICKAALGKENVKLHNSLVRSILRNACAAAEGPPPSSKQAATGNSQTSAASNGALNGGVPAARRARPAATRERRFADKPSPLGRSPLGQPGPGEFVSTGSKAPQEVISVEDGEEVDQARGSPVCVQSKSPIRVRAMLGVATTVQNSPTTCSLDVCYNNGELPDSQFLSKLLGDKLKDHGLSVPRESADILNSGLNAYISQMLKACLGVAKARGNKARACPPNGGSTAAAAAAVNSGQRHGFPVEAGCSYQASLHDLWTAVQSNARLAGFPQQREKIASHLLDG